MLEAVSLETVRDRDRELYLENKYIALLSISNKPHTQFNSFKIKKANFGLISYCIIA